MSYQIVKYKLINNDTLKTLEIGADPQNGDTSDKTIKRSEKNYSVYTEYSKNLIFTKEAAAFLKEAFDYKDIQANVTLEEWRIHPQTEKEYLRSSAVFDFSEYEYGKLTFKAPFKTGGLNALLKSQLKEKFDLERLEAINGNTIDALNIKDVALTSRDIFLISKLECEDASISIYSDSQVSTTKSHRLPLPVKIISNSDQENIVEPLVYNSTPAIESITGSNGETSELLYLVADRDHENVRLSFDISFKIDNESLFVGDVDNKNLYIRLKRYENGETLDFVENISTLISITDNVFNHQDETYTYKGEITVNILQDQSLSLTAEMSGDYGVTSLMNIVLSEIDCKIAVQEDSTFKDSNTKAALFHDIGDKLSQIITGDTGRYYSEFYGNTDLGYDKDGDYSYTAATIGLWIRQFYDKKFEWSIGDFFDTSNAIHNTGYTIEIINNKETIVHEDLKYFFQEDVAIFLPNQVTDIERSTDKNYYCSSIEFGYKEGGDYEEAMGLDEYNVKSRYTLPITRVDKTYSKLSPARADAYAKEFARRKPKLNYPEEDTRYDKDVHLLDLKKGLGQALEERTWSDDYEQAPTGIYSPETATNLRLTPFRNSERHQWFYGSGLIKHQTEKVRHASSDGNAELSTKKTNEVARAENANINISDLKKPRFTNQIIKFTHKVDYDIHEQLYGKTEVNGREIPNWFFKVEFINEFGLKEYGYLLECKPNGKGEFKLLKAA